MLENQGKASITKNMIFKLWQDGYIYFDTKKMQWELDGFDDHFVFEYFEGRKEDYESLLSDLNPIYTENLKRLSILRSSFNMNFVFRFCHLDEETGYAFLGEMEEKKILNKRISDVEYVFVFHDNEFKRVFFDMLTIDERKALYKEASDYYEQRFMANNEVNESLIDYLIQCDELLMAAKYCIIFADHFIGSFNNLKASELLDRASGLYEKLGDKNKVIETGLRLIKQLIKVGKLEDAYEKANEIINLSKSYDEISHVDSKLELSNVLYYKNDVETAYAIAEECIRKSIEIQYIDGEFKSAQMLCRCLTNTVDLDKHIELTRSYLDKCMISGNEYYQAVFQNELGVNHLYRNNYEDSLGAFSESLKCYKNLNDEENIIKAYNNMGVVHFDGYGDYVVARDFFRKAYTHSINRNYIVATPIHLNNLGETYMTEGRYEMAIKYFEESHQIAEKIGDKGVDLLALLNLCSAYNQVEKYGKAFTLMNRLEHEFSTLEKRDFNRQDYYLLHLDFFLSMHSIMKVDKWRYEFGYHSIEDDYRIYRVQIIDMILKYKKNDIVNEKREIPLKTIGNLVEKTVKPSEVKLLRTFIMDVLIDLIDRYDYLSAEELFRLDSILAKRYNTKFIRLKNEVIEAALSDFSIERIENLIEPIKAISHEFLWKVYKILGNENFNRNNLYQALKYYLMALDVIYDLSNNVPLEYKETYILYDNSKMSLKNSINKITKRLLSLDGIIQNVIYDERFETVEDFFDLNQLNRLYHSKEFIRLITENIDDRDEVRFETSIDLIRNLEKDEINNLKLILKYLKHLTFAERAFIYLLDENDNISQVIKADESCEDYDVSKLINNIGNDIDGILITKINPKTNIQLLSDNQKSIICFPVYETSSVKNANDKRKEDLLVTKQKVIGYVFMDSKNLINRFDEVTFEQAKSFINLIYVFIDNYNLKRLSTIDKLTGVYLRKFIEQKFALHMSIARQNNYNLSVIMLDIDKFKFVNDTYGHRKGDEILTRLGEILNNSVRSTDYVARYGGEEFIILLPEADSESGYRVAEKTRTLIENSKLLGDDKPLTVSLGVSTYPKDGANEEELIEKADQALYYSKNNGRNQSTSWDHKLIKEKHRYDRLTGILTGNISSDTRTVKALIDILNQLDHSFSREESIRNAFISLLDITEGDEIQFIKFDENQNIEEVIYKKKGQEKISDELVLNERLTGRFKGTDNSGYFIDWEEVIAYDANLKVPNWKSYIIITFLKGKTSGILSIAVDIKDKEFEFSNYNFVDALKPVLEHVLFN
jgi:diguanylate cyclase (GGDEF)-like protein